MKKKSNPYLIIGIILISMLIVSCFIKNKQCIALLIGAIFAFVITTVLYFKDLKLIKLGKYLKTNSFINLLVLLIAICIIVFIIKDIWFFIGFSIYVIFSRLILYNQFKKLISEDNCGC